jgi:hypothetical protein
LPENLILTESLIAVNKLTIWSADRWKRVSFSKFIFISKVSVLLKVIAYLPALAVNKMLSSQIKVIEILLSKTQLMFMVYPVVQGENQLLFTESYGAKLCPAFKLKS